MTTYRLRKLEEGEIREMFHGVGQWEYDAEDIVKIAKRKTPSFRIDFA
ncbi:hypothetical protein [Natranaerobius thermophilus]|nr:hypothetical protein [Natranaerobius thermophilus]